MRTSLTTLCKSALSTFFAATLTFGLIPAAAFAAPAEDVMAANDTESTTSVISTEASDSERSGEISPTEDIQDEPDPITDELQDDLVGDALASSNGEDGTEDNATTGEDSNLSIPAATERINEDVMLTTPVAQQETTKNYFLAQTLESTRTIPIVSANLPLDKGMADVDVLEPNAEGEGSASEEEDGESSDDPDSEGDPEPVDASFTLASSESDSAVSAESTVIGSFTYRGITYAVEPGGETVAIVAADYSKLPEDFIEAKAIVLPSVVTFDGTDYYSVTRIADYAFSSLNTNEVGIDAITVPATVTEIGDNAFTDFNTLQYIIVSEDNETYSQYDGVLYNADQTCLLLIPEGRLGAVRVAPSVTEVAPEAFSHCASVDTLVTDPASAAYQLLFESDFNNKSVTESAATNNVEQSGFDVFWESHSEDLNRLISSEEDFKTSMMPKTLVMSDRSSNAAAFGSNNWSKVATYTLASTDFSTWTADDYGALYKAISSTQACMALSKHTDSSVGMGRLLTNGPGASTSKQLDSVNHIRSKSPSPGYVGCIVGNYNSTSTTTTVNSKVEKLSDIGLYAHTYGSTTDTACELRLGQNMNEGFKLSSGADASPVYRANYSCDKIEVYKRTATAKIGTAATSLFGLSTDDLTVLNRSCSINNMTDVSNYYIQYICILSGTTTVTLNLNGGSYNGSTANVMVSSVQSPYTPPANVTRTGYTFKGWTTSNSDYAWAQSGTSTPKSVNSTTGCYDLGTSFMIRKDVTFTAQWEPTKYTITYNLDGGTNNSANPSSYKYTDNAITLKEPTKTGYDFDGWTGSNGTTKQKSVTIAKNSTGDKTYTANWTIHTYTITYNLDGGTNNSANPSTYKYTDNAITLKEPTKTGYDFDGWTGSNGTTKQKSVTIAKNSTGDKTYTANWKAKEYNLTLKTFGKDGKWTESTSKYTYGTTITLPGGTVSEGWDYQAWYTDSDFKNKVSGNPSSTTTKDLVFYARYVAHTHTLTFDVNGGTGGQSEPVTATYDSVLPKISTEKPVRPGYQFTGWEGEVVSPVGVRYYTPFYTKDCTSDKIFTCDYDVALRAAWSREPFNAISLVDERLKTNTQSIWYWPGKGYTPTNVNGLPENGSRDDEIKLVSKDDENPSIVAAPSFEDYRFEGYFDENGAQKIDEFGNLLTDEVITEATVWYAKWERLGSAVELKANYGDMVAADIVQGTDKIEHVAFGKEFATTLDGNAVTKIAQTPTRVGYTFMGYYTKENPELSTEDVKNGNIKGKLWIYGENEYDEDVQSGDLVDEEWLTEDEWAKAPTNLVDKGAITLYAAWQLDDCIVEFEIEDNLKDSTERVYVPEGSTALDDRIWHYNKNMDETLPVPGDATFTRNGYDFGGWYYLKDGKTETQVCDKDGVPTDVLKPWLDPTENVTLYAYWTPRTYALRFDPAFPDAKGVEQIYTGETFVEGIRYDESLTLVSPDFGAYDFAGWYVGVPDGAGGWEAGSVPFSDWTTREDVFVEGVHTTDMVKQDDGTYKGRFTPHAPLVAQTYDENAIEPAIIHVVARWDKPIPHTMRFYAGVPGESVEESKIPPIEEPYAFAKAYDFPSTWLPDYGQDGWRCKGWVEVGTKEAAMELLRNGDQEPEDYAGVTGIEAKVTREDYRDLYFVAKWTICPLSVTLESEGEDDTYRVLASDGFHDEVAQGDARTWKAASKSEDDERSYTAVYDVRATPFTLPDLARRGYDFKGWKRKGSEADPVKRLVVDPAVQAQREEDYDWTFEPVFEEITYRIVLKPNGGGLEEQTHERGYTQDFTFYCPVALYTGSVFSSWATKQWEPLDPEVGDGSFRKFHDGMTVPLAPATGDNGEHVFGLTDLIDDGNEYVDDAPRTITLYGIWSDYAIKVDVPLTVNMAVDPETGDVVAAKSTLKPKKGNEDAVYTVESLHYEPVGDERGVPFEGQRDNVFFSIYPDLKFANDTDAYYFLQKDKVGSKGAVTYASPSGEKTATPLLVKLGNRTAPSVLFTRTALPEDYTFDGMALGDATLDTASGFRPFSADDPLDVYYGLHFEGEKRDWIKVLQKYAYGNNAGGWELPRNDAGYQRYTGNLDDEGRRLGWSSDRVDIAKVRYTLSMKTKAPETTE